MGEIITYLGIKKQLSHSADLVTPINEFAQK